MSFFKTNLEGGFSQELSSFEKLLNRFSFPAFVLDKNFKIRLSNKALEREFGASATGKRCYDYFYDIKRPCADCPAKKVFSSGEAASRDFSLSQKWYLEEAFPFRNEKGKILGSIAFIKEITGCFKEKKALKNELNWFQALFHKFPLSIFVIEGGRFSYVNEVLAQSFGYKIPELVRKIAPSDLFASESKSNFEKELKKGLAQEKWNSHLGLTAVRKNGTYFPVEIYQSKVDVGGKKLILGSLIDATETQAKRKRLRSERDKLNSIVQSVSERIIGVDKKGRIVEQGSRTDSGISQRGSVFKKFTRFFPTAKRRQVFRKFKALLKSEKIAPSTSMEKIVLDKGGKELFLEASLTKVGFENLIFLSVIRDVTEKRKEEEKKRAVREQLSTILEESSDSIFLLKIENEKFIFEYVNPRQVEFIREAANRFISSKEIVGSRVEEVFPSELYENIFALVRRVLKTKVSLRSEVKLRDRKGREKNYLLSLTPIKETGKVKGIIGIFQDMTRVRQLQNQLMLSQKMEALGKFAGGIAHDFNNLLTVILGNCELIAMKQASSVFAEELTEIRKAAEMGAELAEKILVFSKQSSLKKELLLLNDVILEARRLLRRMIGEDIKLVTHLQEDLWKMKGDRTQLLQIIMNLAANSRDAMPKGGTLFISTYNLILKKNLESHSMHVPAGNYVVLEIRDTGKGMDEDIMQHIFEPFFTTKPQGEGTGLGLSTVYGIVQQHSGKIVVISSPGEGARFQIFFPPAV